MKQLVNVSVILARSRPDSRPTAQKMQYRITLVSKFQQVDSIKEL